MVRGEVDTRLHSSCPAHPDFTRFFPQVGIRSVDLRPQIASREMVSPSGILGIPRKRRPAILLQRRAKLLNQGQGGINSLEVASVRVEVGAKKIRRFSRSRIQKEKCGQEDWNNPSAAVAASYLSCRRHLSS
jgi:hypothetical protein